MVFLSSCVLVFCSLIDLLSANNTADSKSGIVGANLGGWLLIEEWMFSNGMFDKVAELRDEPQGVILPPMLPNGFGEKWYSEGDLINKLYEKFGEERTIDILQAHRESYVTAADFEEMAASGMEMIRIPVGWWAFANESKSNTPVLITDPFHADRKFVTITNELLTNTLKQIKAAGMSALIDIHAFPGGSADGSYNGIFPNTPMFFKEESLMNQGFDVIANMLDYYDALEEELKSVVTGITLMNEPAHMLPADGQTMQWWLSQAVAMYKERVVSVRETAGKPVPLLFVNLIGTSISDSEITDFMINNFSADELANWAVLDIHVYYAWNYDLSGCTDKWGDCGWSCDVDNDDASFKALADTINTAAASSHANFINNGSIPLIGCSEFSLATYHDSNNACRGQDMLDMMTQAQANGFEAQGIISRALFWSWKMPYGGSHEDSWSLQHYLASI